MGLRASHPQIKPSRTTGTLDQAVDLYKNALSPQFINNQYIVYSHLVDAIRADAWAASDPEK